MTLKKLKSALLVTGIFLFFSTPLTAQTELYEPVFDNTEEVRQYIMDNDFEWIAGETPVSDIPWEEFRETLLDSEDFAEWEAEWEALPKVEIIDAPQNNLKGIDVDISAASFMYQDYEGANWTTDVGNQGMCGSCWAFASLAVLEAMYNLDLGNPNLNFDLSEQYFVACSSSGSCMYGGNPITTVQELRTMGVPDETCYPYIQSEGQCSRACSDANQRIMKSTNVRGIMNGDNAIKTGLKTGPVFCSIYASNAMQYYKGGVFDSGPGGTPNHAIVIVGWDNSDNSWWIKNSWGAMWGIKGFGKVKRTCCAVGSTGTVYNAAITTMAPAICPEPPVVTIRQGLGGANGTATVKLNICANRPGQKSFNITRETGDVGNNITWSQNSGTTSSNAPLEITVEAESSRFNKEGVFGGGGLLLKNDLQNTRIPIQVEVINADPPVADFAADPVAGNPPLKVNFTSLASGGTIEEFHWDFGDGSTSEEENPSHKYVDEGRYTISLRVVGFVGEDTATKKQLVLVSTDDEEIEEHEEEIEEIESEGDAGAYDEEEKFDEWSPDGDGKCGCSIPGRTSRSSIPGIISVLSSLFQAF